MIVDIKGAESWLDSLKPHKGSWPEGDTKEHYLGALALIESMGLRCTQDAEGHHTIAEAEHADV